MTKQKNKNSLPEYLETDILIIGSGGAGLRAAIEATKKGAKILLIGKETMGLAHTEMAMGGLNVAMQAPATPKRHFEDTINGGWKINNYKMAKIFANEMPDRIRDLESYGVKFDKLPNGKYFMWASGKQTVPLNLCAGDYTGREMMQGLVRETKKLKIPYLDNYFVTKLFVKGKKVIGAFLMDLKTGKQLVVSAKATIVATGGAGMMYLVNTNATTNTGEGYSWALNAGAKLVDMEFVQFHPTGMAWPPEKKGRLVTEKVRGNGGILKNKLGERFMARYQPQRMELAGRDEVSRAIYQEINEGRGTKHNAVYLDVTHWEKGRAQKLVPDVFQDHMEVGIDIRKQMMEISPSMHHMMGGVNINEWGETNVKGLYAAGEVTRNVHGANRLGGNSIAEGQVFGRRVGIQTSKDVRKIKLQKIPDKLVAQELKRINKLSEKKKGVNPNSLLHKLQVLMWDYVGLIRNEKKLKYAYKEIKKFQKDAKNLYAKNSEELQRALELIEMLNTAEMVVACAIIRKESRGSQFRSDYTKMDDKWVKNIMIYKDTKGKLKTKIVSVVLP